MVIDQSKCIGCGYCTSACQAHNDSSPDIQWNRVSAAGAVAGKTIFLPRPCMHCAKAPCVEVCPVKASYYRDDGIVMMDYDRCIGCRYCEAACPYEARSFNWKDFDGPNPAVPEWGQPEVERRPPRRGRKMQLLLPAHRSWAFARPAARRRSGCDSGLLRGVPYGRSCLRRSQRSRIRGQPAPRTERDIPPPRKPGNGAARLLHRC